MKETHHYLYLGLFFSLLLHLSIFYTVVWNNNFLKQYSYRPKSLVAVRMVQKAPETSLEKVAFEAPKPPPAIEPLPLPVQKPKMKRALKPKHVKHAVVKPSPGPDSLKTPPENPLPLSNNPKAKTPPSDAEDIKPVFGVNPDSIAKSGDSVTAVRVGNTLMKGQEEEFTPPDEVKTYAVVPVFELSSMPVYRSRVEPDYPAELKSREIEGEVLLTATIDQEGKVVKVTVKRSDDELFSKAAIAALKQCSFSPGMQNDKPVTTTIDIPIKFILDE